MADHAKCPECPKPCSESRRLAIGGAPAGESFVGSHGARAIRAARNGGAASGAPVSARQSRACGDGECSHCFAPLARTYDGTCNNLEKPQQAAACTPLARKAPVAYGDGISSLAERLQGDEPNPRAVSNAVCFQIASTPSARFLSDLFWSYGQFIDHEIDLTGAACPAEDASFVTPDDDPVQAGATVPFERSVFVKGTGTSTDNPREQLTVISAYLDGTNVYGSSFARARELRRLDGSGKLRTVQTVGGEFPLFNKDGWDNANGGTQPDTTLCMCGDVRANENVLLLSLHTIFVREHNRLCDALAAEHCFRNAGNDEYLYQTARRYVTALIQKITYDEFLPLLLGEGAIPAYTGYQSNVDASVRNEFSTVAYRVGHTMVSQDLNKRDASGGQTPVPLTLTFFAPELLTGEAGALDAFVRGAAWQLMQEIDTRIVSALRSFLFGPPTAQQLIDLAALNIQRGRDHGIPDFNSLREACGLEKYDSIDDITDDQAVRDGLNAVYNGDVNAIDPWIGGLAEPHGSQPGDAQVGELFFTILVDQFTRFRDGDRLWWERDECANGLSAAHREQIRGTTLRDVVLRNTDITDDQLPVTDTLFVVPP